MTEEMFAELTAKFRRQYGNISKEIEARIVERIRCGEDPMQAIQTILTAQPPSTSIKAPLSELLLMAAINGTGRSRESFTKSMLGSMQNAVVNLPWAPDNMPLSDRLHKLSKVMRQALNDEISKAMKNGTNWVALSRKIYDGYGYDKKIKKAEDIPKYLKELQQAAKRVIGDDPQAMEDYKRLLRKTARQVDKLQTPGLRAAYDALIDAADKGNAQAIERAIKTALEERSRYYAERIARTELARAWADGFYAKTLDDKDVIAYKWRLSRNHPVQDICDFHAKANLYGLGAGIYPKNKMPPLPAHPHCRCHITEIFDGELDDKQQTDKVHEDGQKFLETLTPAEQRKLLGVDGRERWRNGEPWEQHLIGWAGHENPRSRLKGLVKSGESDIIKAEYADLSHLRATMKDSDVRKWYKWHDEHIGERLDKTLSLEGQAKQAHALRNRYRTEARELMADQQTRKKLDETRPNIAFDELLADKVPPLV